MCEDRMIIATHIDEVRRWRYGRGIVGCGETVALVPTMGALHAGHASLISQAKACADRVAVSIFVNQLQFDDVADFESYPETRAEDIELCSALGVDLVFMPCHDDMYPAVPLAKLVVPNLSQTLCGAVRPGHFDGVGLVVAKLFNIVGPHVALFGRKDLQQLLIIQRIVQDLSFDIKIEPVPIFRESDGLALSSRNKRLSADHRKRAPQIFKALQQLANEITTGAISDHIVATVQSRFRSDMAAIDGTRVDYIDIVDGETLGRLDDQQLRSGRVAYIATAVFFGDVRLIDNVAIEVAAS